MSVTPNNLVFYSSADMATADGTTTGGAVNFASRIGFSDLASTQTVSVVSSSGSDTATTIAVSGRDSTGTIKTETITLSGTTIVAGTQSFQRLLQGTVGGTTPVGDVALISSTEVVSGTAQAAANTSGVTGPYITLQSGQGTSVALDDIVRITNNTPTGVEYQLRRIVAISTDTVTVNEDWSTVP